MRTGRIKSGRNVGSGPLGKGWKSAVVETLMKMEYFSTRHFVSVLKKMCHKLVLAFHLLSVTQKINLT